MRHNCSCHIFTSNSCLPVSHALVIVTEEVTLAAALLVTPSLKTLLAEANFSVDKMVTSAIQQVQFDLPHESCPSSSVAKPDARFLLVHRVSSPHIKRCLAGNRPAFSARAMGQGADI